MRFRVAKDALSEAVQWTARALPTRPAVPILAGVKLTAIDGTLELSSFDYEVSARSEITADVETPGEALVSGKMLSDISKSLPNRDVHFDLEDGRVRIKCGNAGFTLATMSLDDYPTVPALPQKLGTVSASEFASAIQQVVIAASKDETLPLLTGVRIEIEGSKMTLLATDRYRLAMREMEWEPADPSVSVTVLVKSKVLADVARSMASSGSIDIFLNQVEGDERNSIIGFSAGGRQATSVLMDGDYPPVRKLFPESTPLEYICNRQELLEAVKRVSLVVDHKTSVRLNFEDGALVLEAGQGDNASANEAVESFTQSEELKTAFNPQYLQEGLAVCDTEYVKFGFTDATKAAVLEPRAKQDEETDAQFHYLLMPIRFGA